MLSADEAIDLLNRLKVSYQGHWFRVALVIPDGPGDEEIRVCEQEIRNMGYMTMWETNAVGDQIVITDKFPAQA